MRFHLEKKQTCIFGMQTVEKKNKIQKVILSKTFVTGRGTVYEMTLQAGRGVNQKRPNISQRCRYRAIRLWIRKMVGPPLITEKFHSQSPNCVQTSHFETNVGKLGSGQKKCDAMFKQLMNRNARIVKQLNLNIKI